jgi:hypothetical protein
MYRLVVVGAGLGWWNRSVRGGGLVHPIYMRAHPRRNVLHTLSPLASRPCLCCPVPWTLMWFNFFFYIYVFVCFYGSNTCGLIFLIKCVTHSVKKCFQLHTTFPNVFKTHFSSSLNTYPDWKYLQALLLSTWEVILGLVFHTTCVHPKFPLCSLRISFTR